jgi:dynein light chain roadblock-type
MAIFPSTDPFPPLLLFSALEEVSELVRRLSSHKGVVGVVIVNHDGIPIRTTLEPQIATQYCALLQHLALNARSLVQGIDSDDDLDFIRIRSQKHEILVAPGANYLLIVVQDTTSHAEQALPQ